MIKKKPHMYLCVRVCVCVCLGVFVSVCGGGLCIEHNVSFKIRFGWFWRVL